MTRNENGIGVCNGSSCGNGTYRGSDSGSVSSSGRSTCHFTGSGYSSYGNDNDNGIVIHVHVVVA